MIILRLFSFMSIAPNNHLNFSRFSLKKCWYFVPWMIAGNEIDSRRNSVAIFGVKELIWQVKFNFLLTSLKRTFYAKGKLFLFNLTLITQRLFRKISGFGMPWILILNCLWTKNCKIWFRFVKKNGIKGQIFLISSKIAKTSGFQRLSDVSLLNWSEPIVELFFQKSNKFLNFDSKNSQENCKTCNSDFYRN